MATQETKADGHVGRSPRTADDDHHDDGHEHGRADDHGHAHDDEADHAHGDHGHAHGDDHGHDHDDHEHKGGPLGWLAELFGGHSHGAPVADEALEGSDEGIRAVKISLVALFITAALQAVIVVFSGSVALLADTIHNLADALTAVPLWIAFVVGRRPANRRYTYGYGRAEDVAGLAIVAMIALSAAVAGWESVRKLFDPEPMQYIWLGDRGVGDRVHRERGRGDLPHPSREADRQRGAGGGRPARARGRPDLAGGAVRRARRAGRVPAGRSDRRPAHHDRDRLRAARRGP